MLQENFFVKSNLLKFFNGRKVTRESPRSGNVSDATQSFHGRVQIESLLYPKGIVDVKFERRDTEHARIFGSVTLKFERRTAPTLREVQNVFGTNADLYPDGFSPHYYGPITRTSKGWYEYELRGQQADEKRSIRREFWREARVSVNLNGPIEPSTEGKVTILTDNNDPSPNDTVGAIYIFDSLDDF